MKLSGKPKKPNGHPMVYYVLAAVAIGLWFIPNQAFSGGAHNFSENLGVLNFLMKNATVTVKGAGTLGAVVLMAVYNWKKS